LRLCEDRSITVSRTGVTDMDDELKGPVYPEWDPSAYVKALTRDLEAIALPSEAQIRWLAEKNLPIEELWLRLTDEMVALRYGVKAGAVSGPTAAALGELYRHMDSMTGESFASYAALDGSAWQRARELAANALEQMRATKTSFG
jgi:hypothetical protein